MRTSLLLASVTALATAAGAMGRHPPKTETKMTVQEWKGQYGGPLALGAEVVGDARSWEALWQRLGKDAPPLDFAKYVAVAAFAGERPTGGWTLDFSEPKPAGDDLVIEVRVKKPTGFTTQAFAQPWRVRAVPRPKGTVRAEFKPE